ncbi:MAG: hypothetical protein IKM04_02885 [Clostridia bacterium]|nr:hypothetical protein [Clostridia bacterium]
MKMTVDNDLHIHSTLSSCSGDPEQTPERILRYAEENSIRTVCITDHFWDEAVEGASGWYKPQNFPHISHSKPLPKAEGIRFLFGCETELDKFLTLGLSPEKYGEFDFIVIPTTHFHMRGFTLSDGESADTSARARAWFKRLNALLDMDLPFHKIGLAHLTCQLIAPTHEEYLEVLNKLPKEELRAVFTKAAGLGVGIELNRSDFSFAEGDAEAVTRIYKVARDCGCKFYFGSDAHHPAGLDGAPAVFERAVELLGLTEDNKFLI